MHFLDYSLDALDTLDANGVIRGIQTDKRTALFVLIGVEKRRFRRVSSFFVAL